ncbi:MAG TPA: hypothetical protein VGQ94_11095, partial [Terriglobales bacterium]|nr:hypothetical protein [Terriglobales bacterium]
MLVELLGLLELELRPLLELWPPAEELPLLAWLPPELLPELPLELCPLLEPEPEGELLWPELPLALPLPPELELDDPELEEPVLEAAEPEEPELGMKFSRRGSRRGSGDLPPPEVGAGSAAGEVASEPELLPPLPPELALPLEPEPAVGESLVMLGGNWRRGSGTRCRPEAGEEPCEAAPEPPEVGLPPEEPELPEPELVITTPDWPPAPRRSRALRIASSSSISRSRPEGRRPESAAGWPLPPEPTDPPEPLPALTPEPEPPEGVAPGPEPGVPTPPEP